MNKYPSFISNTYTNPMKFGPKPNMATPEQLRRTYIGLKGHLTRLINKAEGLTKDTPIDSYHLETSVRVADLKFDQVKSTGQSYLDLLNTVETDPDQVSQIVDDISQYEEETQDIIIRLSKLAKQSGSNTSHTGSHFNNQLPEVRLPTLDLPTFSGLDTENWDNFWTSFEVHIHKKPSLDKVSKFSYLLSLLQGEAKKVIHNLTLDEINYEEAIKLLKLNYCNKELSIATLYYQLLDLNAPNSRPESLQSFRLEVESLVKALGTKVNIPASEWSIKLLLQRKLPRNVLTELCSHYNTEFLTLDQIFEGLRITVNRLKTHDKIKPESKPTSTDISVKPKQTQSKSNKYKSKTTPSTGKRSGNVGTYSVSPEITNDLSTKETKSINQRRCLFCNQGHTTYQCSVYPTYNVRVKRLQELHKCTKCMGSHDPKKCAVQLRSCNRCNQGVHHYALCRKSSTPTMTTGENSMNSTAVQYCKVHQEVNVLATESGNNTTLPTAQLKLINRRSRINTRGLFDQGSQKTFITQQLVDELNLKPTKSVRLNISGFLSNSGPRDYKVVKVLVRLGSSTSPIQAVVVDKLPTDLQVTGLARTARHLKRNRMRLADYKINSDCLTDVGILIGADHYYKFITGCTRQHGMNLLSSAGGKLLTGPVLFRQGPASTNQQSNNIIVA
ncbi:uncharacterized protein [Procambarus clarkii]|uniref:uncharacterized protein isoform X1 n=1 Tax=Procambarus clarkii TaxID=6728 RepID=UPI003743EDD3